MSGFDCTLPDPPIGVFDARPYREYDPGRGWFAEPEAKTLIPPSPRGILIVGLTACGDVLHFLPVAVALHRAFPKARLGWVVQDKARAMVEGRDDLSQVHVFERNRWARSFFNPSSAFTALGEILSFRSALKGGGYDMLLDPQGTAKSALVNLASGVKLRIGFAAPFCRELNHVTTTAHVMLPSSRIHRVRKSLALLQAAGVDTSKHGARYRVPPGVQEESDRDLDRHGLMGKRLLMIHPGTSEFGARKRWPLDRFARMADEAHAEMGLVPAFILGPGERGWKDGLLSAVKTSPCVALEPPTLAHLGGMLSRASCFVGCDSGPLHLASNLRVPVVGLYGPTDPVLFAPYYPPAVVVVKGLICGRCGASHCNHPNPRMEAITVGEVMQGLRLLHRLTSPG